LYQQAEQGTDRATAAFALLEYGEQEEHRFQPFAGDGEKHHGDQREHLVIGVAECLFQGGLQRVLDRAGDLAHPEHHGRQNHHRQQADQAFEQLLLFLREFRADHFQAATHQQGQGAGEQYANPYGGHPLAAAGLLQVAGDDADDERGFNTFAQHDQEWDEHGTP
jgi:hypothetical protein